MQIAVGGEDRAGGSNLAVYHTNIAGGGTIGDEINNTRTYATK